MRIIGDDDQELPVREVGMTYMTSLTHVDLEYLDDPEKTAAAHRGDKQFTLGDMGWLDEDGYLFVADRRVDMIITGGANVYPAEVEAVLTEHEAIADVAVIGLADEEWGKRVHAVVQFKDGAEPLPIEALALCPRYSPHMPSSLYRESSQPPLRPSH